MKTREEIESLLTAAAAYEAKADAGPWQACGTERGGCSCGNVWCGPADDLMFSVSPEGPNGCKFDVNGTSQFIAWARGPDTGVPALAAALREQMARAAAAELALEDMERAADDWASRFHQAAERADKAKAQADKLRAMLTDAVDGWEDAASYVSEYFQQTWGITAKIAEMRAAVKGMESSNE